MKSVPSFLLFLLISYSSFAQNCENSDFELGNFTNWQGFTGGCCGQPINNPGIVPGQHTIISSPGFDPYTNNMISMMAPGGGSFSVRLGNDQVNSEAERLRKTFLVTADNAAFIYQYAVILQDPAGHDSIDKPKFEVRVIDQNDNPVAGPCGYYQVTAGPATDDWQSDGEDVRFKDWSIVGVDLSAYIGQMITIEFITQDCGLGAHFGYAYIDAACGKLEIIVQGYCNDSSTVTLTAPFGFSKYEWEPGGETTQSITMEDPQEGDTVLVHLTNEAGCKTSILYVFNILGETTADIDGNDTTICAGESVQLMGKSTFSDDLYRWYSQPAGFSSTVKNPTVTPLTTTTYYLIVTNKNGCAGPDSLDSIKVTVNDSLLFNLGPDQVICKGDSLTLKGPLSTTFVYQWTSRPAGLVSSKDSVIVKPLQNTVYYLTVSNSQCSLTDSISISLYKSFGKDTIYRGFCEFDTAVYITAPSGYSNYFWPVNGSASSVFMVKPPKADSLLEVRMQSVQGCLDTLFFRLKQNANPVASILTNDTTICPGSDLLIQAAQAGTGIAYYWTSVPPGYYGYGPNISVSPSGNTSYILHVEDSLGCTGPESIDTIKVEIVDSIEFDLGDDLWICAGDSIMIGITYDPFLTYEWSSTPSASLPDSSLVKVSPSVNTLYTLKVTKDNCSFSDYVRVYLGTLIISSPQYVNFCKGSTGIPLTAPFGTGYQYFWPFFSSNAQMITVNAPLDGDIYSVVVTNSLGCSDTLDFILKEVPLPVASAGPDQVICKGESALLSGSGAGISGSYEWHSNPPGFYSTQQTATVTPSQSSWYVLKVTDKEGCSGLPSIDSLWIEIDTSAMPELGPDYTICPGESVVLSSQAGIGNYSWTSSPPGFSSTDPQVTVSPSATTTYMLNMSNANCNYTDFVTVNVHIPAAVNAGPDDMLCIGDSYQLQPNLITGGTYSWTSRPPGFTSSEVNPVVQPEESTVYTVAVDDGSGCLVNDSVKLTVLTYPVPQLPELLTICEGDSILLSPGPDSLSYTWSTGETKPAIYISQAGTYEVTVTNVKCSTNDAVVLEVLEGPDSVLIPNVFTPNGDGKNDRFEIIINNVIHYEVKVFTRWGELVYESNDPALQWDGMIGAGRAPEGVYFWLFTYIAQCDRGKVLIKDEGTVTLLR